MFTSSQGLFPNYFVTCCELFIPNDENKLECDGNEYSLKCVNILPDY